MKRAFSGLGLMVFAATLFGCASAPIIPVPVKFTGDMRSLSPLTVVAFQTVGIRQVTIGRTLAGALTLGLGSNAIAESGGRAMQKKYSLPDLGQTIKGRFVKRVTGEIPYWPEMQVEENPMPLGPFKTPNSVLVFRTFFVQVSDAGTCQGLCAYTDLTLFGKNGQKYQKRYIYKSENFNRAPRSFSDFERDEGKLLKEEMEFAAEKTVEHFIGHFKGGGSSGN